MHNILYSTIKRDLCIYTRHKGEWISSILLFVIIVSLYPIALGNISEALIWMTPAIIWISAILSIMLFQDGALREDFQIGTFEQAHLSNASLVMVVLGKVTAAWIVTCLPLALISPILGLSFDLPTMGLFAICISLLCGTPALAMVAALGCSLTLSLPRGGMLLTVLILPLYVPILVLGTGACSIALHGAWPLGYLALLSAISIGSIMLCPLAISAMIRVSME